MKIHIDEAWRWPLAGPMYVGLVIPLKKFSTKAFKDSKVLSEKKREELYEKILVLAEKWKILFASGNVTNTVIDKKWLTKSLNFAIRKGITRIVGHDVSQCSKRSKKALLELTDKYDVTWLMIDGKHDFGLRKDLDVEVETLVGGDAKNAYISMASIIAKVERDRVMLKFAKKYPEYMFEQHKWYGTKLHKQKIEQHWVCPIHRKSFLSNII